MTFMTAVNDLLSSVLYLSYNLFNNSILLMMGKL